VVALATLLAALSTTWYAWTTAGQLSTMIKQLAQTESQTRPWVGVAQISTNEPLRVGLDLAINSTCKITGQNFGTYPAQNVFGSCDLVAVQDITKLRARERSMCFQGIDPQGGYVLFPGIDTNTWEWSVLAKRTNALTASGGAKDFQLYLLGCLRYRDQSNIPHCTTVGYRRQPVGSIVGSVFEFKLQASEIPGVWVKWDGSVDPKEDQ
jgi:hypothetical protein